MDDGEDGEGPGMSLSALEEKLKPEVLATFEEIEALYKKLHKMQHRRLETMTSGEEVSPRSEKTYEKAREELVSKVEQVRLHNNRIEELVTQLKQLNQRLNALEGQLLRMAEGCKVRARRIPASSIAATSWIRTGSSGWRRCPARAGSCSPRKHFERHRHDARRRSPPWRTMPACRSASSAAST